jgi:hypothetical protein
MVALLMDLHIDAVAKEKSQTVICFLQPVLLQLSWSKICVGGLLIIVNELIPRSMYIVETVEKNLSVWD